MAVVSAGRGQRGFAQMVVEIDGRLVDPARVIEVIERWSEALGEDRDRVQPALEELPEVLVETALEAGGQLEVGEARHMHGGLRRFQVQESSIQATEFFHCDVSRGGLMRGSRSADQSMSTVCTP